MMTEQPVFALCMEARDHALHDALSCGIKHGV